MKNFYDLSEDDIIMLAKTDHEACDFLLRKYSYMVKRIARSFYLVGAENDDLIQEGMLGLYNAICTYEPDKATFSTYCVLCIKNAILDAVKSNNRLKHQPLNNSVSYTQMDEESNSSFMLDLFTNGIDSAEIIAMQNEDYATLLNYIKDNLSQKDIEVLRLYLNGLTYLEIAKKTNLEYKKVDNTIQKIKRKLNKKRD